MRKVFSSQRVETVEGVAQLLGQAGIEVRIRNGRSWQGKRGGQFSYLDHSDGSTHPAVWVVRADDQVHARQLLRQAGLLESTRPLAEGTQQALALTFNALAQQKRSGLGLARWRIILLILISLAALMIVMLQRAPVPVTPLPQTKPVRLDESAFRVPIYRTEE